MTTSKFKEKILAIYKGWRIRHIINRGDIGRILNELKVLYSKINSVMKTGEPGITIVKSAYDFKKRQFHVLLSAKIGLPNSLGRCRNLTLSNLNSKISKKSLENEIISQRFNDITRNKFKQLIRNVEVVNSKHQLSNKPEINRSACVECNNDKQKEENPLEILAKLNSLLMKVKKEKLRQKMQTKQEWEKYDSRFAKLIDELKCAYENMK